MFIYIGILSPVYYSILVSSIYGMSVHAMQGALQCKISTFLIAMVPTNVLNIELRDSRTIIFPHTPLGPYTARVPFVQTPRELTLPNKSATRMKKYSYKVSENGLPFRTRNPAVMIVYVYLRI